MKPIAASRPSLADDERDQVLAALALHQGKPGPLLEILHSVQERLGYVPAAAVPIIADALNLSRADVYGVITFYEHFRSSKPGRYTIQLCQAEACRAMGAERLTAHVKARLGIDFHETTADGRWSLEPVYCLGNCACSPAMLVASDLHGRVTAASFDEMLRQLGDAP
jgi:formate dehydrogenase subunit gamma